VQRLQVELVGRLGGSNFIVGRCTASVIVHVAEIIFLSF
jgi:hypothetical protein